MILYMISQSRPFVNNKALLQERLDDIRLDPKFPFEETLAFVAEKELEIEEVEDDLKREVEFYNQALNAVKLSRKQLDKAGVKHMRPVDYFAEMVKSDKHMGRVKQHLLFEKQKMEGFERRKQQKEFKKYSKQLQAEKQKQKGAQKKKVKELANQYRGKTPDALATLGSSGMNKKRERATNNEAKFRQSAKRQAKDKKYGSGYVKGSKKNSAKSSADMSDFSTKKNKTAFPGMKAKIKKRPGKSRRMNRRSG
uniref:rRNA-processing protein EBP2 n=1 Tax=Aplanochytrium stocchinoi TaxID=215587 RepID=A0A7S3LLH5_9STRA